MTPTTLYHSDKAEVLPTSPRARRAGKALELAAIGCLLAGAVSIHKALQMDQASDMLLCLAGSVGACVLVCYLYFRKE